MEDIINVIEENTEDTIPVQEETVIVNQGGTTDHANLRHLDYEESGHTGFASSDDIENIETELDNKANISDIPDVSNFITNTVNNLLYYYKKTETYTQTEINNLISAISTLNLEVVQTLPIQDISTTTIYLVPKTTAETNDVYDEYIYVSNAWEHIGSTQADLTNYYTKTQVDAKVNFYDGSTTYTTVQSTMERLITDFQGALDEKAYVSDVVDLTSAQTISGAKTFANSINFTGDGGLQRAGSTKLGVARDSVIFYEAAIPYASNSRTLGTSARQWKTLFLSGDLTDGTNSIAVNKIANKDNFVTLTQAEYDLLTPDANTYYFIEEE